LANGGQGLRVHRPGSQNVYAKRVGTTGDPWKDFQLDYSSIMDHFFQSLQKSWL
jgi:hypothetical protein